MGDGDYYNCTYNSIDYNDNTAEYKYDHIRRDKW